jgi:Uma2 family endonuclease
MESQVLSPLPELTDTRSEAAIQYEIERNKPIPSKNHSKAQKRLIVALDNMYGDDFDIYPELEISFTAKNCVPDIAIYPIESDNWAKDHVRRTDLPNLVIEILSPRQVYGDIIEKIEEVYFPAGMLSAWVVLPPNKAILLMKSDGTSQFFTTGILKDDASGFEVDLAKIFK